MYNAEREIAGRKNESRDVEEEKGARESSEGEAQRRSNSPVDL